VLQKLATRIKLSKGSNKDKLYLSVFGGDRERLLETIILRLPAKAYVLDQREVGYSLKQAVNNVAGIYAEIDTTEKLLRGMAVKYPDQIKVTFTLGLDEIVILPKKG
jgi:hypothetical protein